VIDIQKYARILLWTKINPKSVWVEENVTIKDLGQSAHETRGNLSQRVIETIGAAYDSATAVTFGKGDRG